jgi:hypothetical protein
MKHIKLTGSEADQLLHTSDIVAHVTLAHLVLIPGTSIKAFGRLCIDLIFTTT